MYLPACQWALPGSGIDNGSAPLLAILVSHYWGHCPEPRACSQRPCLAWLSVSLAHQVLVPAPSLPLPLPLCFPHTAHHHHHHHHHLPHTLHIPHASPLLPASQHIAPFSKSLLTLLLFASVILPISYSPALGSAIVSDIDARFVSIVNTL